MASGLVLTLDGSTAACSAALLRGWLDARDTGGWEVVSQRLEADGRAQARVLLHLVDDMLRETGAEPADLRAIVAGAGPGTFTGVRITVATARALALALRVPVLGVSTLAALAAQAAAGLYRDDDSGVQVLMPVVDAHRGQVFYAVYRREPVKGAAAYRWLRTQAYATCDRAQLPALAHETAVAGSLNSGSEKSGGGGHETAPVLRVLGDAALAPAQSDVGRPGVEFQATSVNAAWLLQGQQWLDEPGQEPLGTRLTAYVARATDAEIIPGDGPIDGAAAGAIGSPESVRPIYVRAPDADLHITKMRDPWAGR